MLGHTGQLDTIRIELGHTNFIVLWWVADLDIGGFDQLLVGLQDLLEELRSNHIEGWHVVLPVKIKKVRRVKNTGRIGLALTITL